MSDDDKAEREDPELRKRRMAAEARKAAAEERRASRGKSAELLEIERIEREAAEAEAIDHAECEYGEVDQGIKVVRSHRHDQIVIVRKPMYAAVKAFHDKGKFTVEAKDKLGRPYVVYPSREAYAQLAADDVALVVAVADAVAWLGGFGRTELEEKSEA